MGRSRQTPCLSFCRRQAHGCVGDAGELQQVTFTKIQEKARLCERRRNKKLTIVLQVPMLVILVFNTLFLIWVILVRSSRLLWPWILCQQVSTSLILLKLFSTKIIIFTFFFNPDCNSQAEAKSSDSGWPRQKTLESGEGDILPFFFHYSERRQTSEENNEN